MLDQNKLSLKNFRIFQVLFLFQKIVSVKYMLIPSVLKTILKLLILNVLYVKKDLIQVIDVEIDY